MYNCKFPQYFACHGGGILEEETIVMNIFVTYLVLLTKNGLSLSYLHVQNVFRAFM